MFTETPRFEPHPLVRGGHLQTVFGALASRDVPPTSSLTGLRRVAIPLRSGGQLEGWHAPSESGRSVLLAHGLGGSVDSPYLSQTVHALLADGAGVLAIQHRGSGGNLEETTRPYMTGHTSDLADTVRWLRRVDAGATLFAVGYSISGNTLLKHLGEGGRDLPDAAIAVAPPVDLDACSQDLLRLKSRPFDLWILRSCRRWIPRLRGDYDGPVDVQPWHSLRAFDERYITPVWGFESLEDYYRSASAIHYVEAIETPTLVLHAADDPVVDARHSRAAPFGPGVRVDIVEGGGHLGFVARGPHGGRLPWLPAVIAHHVRSFQRADPCARFLGSPEVPCAAP